ncbi:MAG: L-glutamate gamma-semialdehyde dehydrogenase [Flavobacteriaceae bacterium]|jgi:1-pyrroline-5-carboxylate dehydrogenase|nr:L-glutamate gamma-semialdehyde dehydrogenase [Flavobacteriaceae bacterium]MBT4113894.1 L-glutamate gamma-semialdehyde dehydrogenase [Flavobacteriaceae bacterium]MBT4613747.1 L-glutamate gamma-semialdehyde dehydrogenase [Flavobacteriaceae bacterium]MBT5246327.1 L-glutamate gamma-semialdehyde dehydrogenase [Flavobacteriaceae bacterium]MBT5650380.1 L-glutamate gamma-semialdehyde dehydrogenase [Flavobacteriaceae bacterium]
MSIGFFKVPTPINEPVKSYLPGSSERKEVLNTYKKMIQEKIEIPMYINGKDVKSDETNSVSPPHDHKNIVAKYYLANESHVNQAISTALDAKESWENMSWENRAAIFLRAAELIAGPYRSKINAATMIGQSKTIHQAEIDAACELIDFLRFNVQYITDIYSNQPDSDPDAWNRVEYRPLEGFVYAVTPFNFTAIAGNLAASMAMLGNVVVWKPSDSQVYSAKILIDVYKEAGLPDGVINAVFGDPEMISNKVLESRDFAGLHFTGSTVVFNSFWKKIGANISNYKTYPKIVGETGGKDFILAHKSANPKEVSTAITRGAFEFQGQKCSAASRGYISKSIWNAVKANVIEDLKSINMGSPDDLSNFMTAVIHENSFDKIAKYIDNAKADSKVQVIAGGSYNKSKGYFIEPTVLVAEDPNYVTMREEIFGPVITIYVYDDNDFDKTLGLIDSSTKYALTGAVLSKDRNVIEKVTKALRNAAGNFYVNDKPTGAVVGKQPFGGARGSGTNDKAGSMLNLLRWVSPRLIKETFVTPTDYRYPFLGKD